jgi:hypothetical protein
MHQSSLQEPARSNKARHSAAKDRTFKTVRSNQGTLNDAPKRLWWDADAHDRENPRIPLRNDEGGAERRCPVLR